MVNCSTAITLLSLSALARANIFTSNTPDTAMGKFKQKAGLKEFAAPVVHTVGRRSKLFEIGGESVSFDQLVPVSDLFAPGAKVMIDGVEQDPQVFLYESPANPGVKVLLDKRKKLIKASKRKSNGDITDLLRVEGKEFAEVNPNDIDQTQFEGYNTGDAETPTSRSSSRSSSRSLRGLSSSNGHHRHLMQVSPPNPDCEVIAKGTVYIAADSDFVADANAECDFCDMENGNKAAAAIQEIFAAVKEVFLRDNCVDLTLKGYDIRPDPKNDPYRDVRLASGEVCTGDDSFLGKFTNWLNIPGNDPSNKDRTVFHLFYGNPDAGSGYRTVGCAYYDGQCNPWYGTSVSEMSWKGTYSTSLTIKRNLLAHELGHSFNAAHNSGIMASNIGTDEHFTTFSVAQVQGCVNGDCRNDCLEFVSNTATNSDPTLPPTSSPIEKSTSSPTSVPSTLMPSRGPTTIPTSLPTSQPTGTPVEEPTNMPTSSPTGSPTSVPTTAAPSEQPLVPSSPPTTSPIQLTASPSKTPTLPPSPSPTAKPSMTPTTMATSDSVREIISSSPPTFPSTNENGQVCVAMPASCSNPARRVENCCSTTTMRCKRRGKKRGRRRHKRVCTGVWA